MSSWNIGVVGATGAVGIEILEVLGRRRVCRGENLFLFASARSAGSRLPYRYREANSEDEVTVTQLPVQLLDWETNRAALLRCDLLLLAGTSEVAATYAPLIHAEKPEMVVIDNSSHFRYSSEVPLVVPEINGSEAFSGNLIANPNCTTAIMAMCVFPIHKRYGVRRFLCSTYQAASGAGRPGMDELEAAMRAYGGQPGKPEETSETQKTQSSSSVFGVPLLANLVPQIDAFEANGYTREEMKVVWETRKIFGEPEMAISCTAVRVPTLRAHAKSVTLELEKPFAVEDIQKLLEASPGVQLRDAPTAENRELRYPMPLTATGKDDVQVGRVRRNPVFENGLDLWVCGDQLLRGAALNAVLIAELRMNKDTSK